MTTFTLFWIAADRQSSIKDDVYSTREEAQAAIPAFKALLLAGCGLGEPEQEAEIENGFFAIDESDEEE